MVKWKSLENVSLIRLWFIKSKRKSFADIAAAIPGVKFDQEASWNRYTSLGAGAAPFPLFRVGSTAQASDLIVALKKEYPDLKIRPIGGGTNLVGADRTLPDTVFLKIYAAPGGDLSQIYHAKDGIFFAGAALSLKNVLDFACANSFGGAAGLYGIPGTIGGATVMNAGANGQCISEFIESIEFLDLNTGKVKRHRKISFDWAYRHTSIPEDQMILRVIFRFNPIDPEAENVLLKRELLRRMRAPAGRSAGSVFRNPATTLPAGRILEKCGAKSLTEGRFQVSPDHANWIINRVDRTELAPSEKAFVETTEAMAQKVYDSIGIILKPEVRFIDMETAEKWGTDRPRIKVLVLKGGVSSEREVSLLSAAGVAKSLRDAGFDVREYDIQQLEITEDMRWADVVYPVLHGGFGEDGTLQKMLEDAGIKTVGSPSESMKIVMDKVASKKVMDENGITNARYAVVTDSAAPIPEGMELPLIVKPNSEGSTFGLTLVETPDQWQEALALALKHDKIALVEEYIEGIEATVGILLGKALPPVEIRYPGKLYDYDAKYTHAQGETLYLCPPQGIVPEAVEEMRDLCLRFAKALHAETLVRVDVIVRKKDNKVYVLEGNSMPGCTESSLLPKAAMAAGITLMELYSGLVMDALKK